MRARVFALSVAAACLAVVAHAADLPTLSTQAADPSLTNLGWKVGSSRVDLQACKLEYSIVSPK